MDFLSRDRYRQAVEELAEPSGEAQLRVALRSVESARAAAAAQSSEHRSAHVGWHLIGRGRPDFETDVAYHPGFAARARRFIFAHATAVYLGAVGLLTLGLVGLAAAYVRASGGTLAGALWAAALLLLPASELAIAAGPAPRRTPGPAAPAPEARFPERRASGSTNHGGHPHPAHQPGRSDATARAPRGGGPREHRSAHPLCPSHRLRRRPAQGDAGRCRIARGRARGNRGNERSAWGRDGATSSTCSIGSASGIPVKEPGSAGSASAGSWRNSITCCAGRRTPASRSTKATPRFSPTSATASRWTATPSSRVTPPAN